MLTSDSAVFSNVTYVPQRPPSGGDRPPFVQRGVPRDAPSVTLPPISSLVPPSSYPAGIAGIAGAPLAAPPRMLVAPQLAMVPFPARARPAPLAVGRGPVPGAIPDPASGLSAAARLRKQCPVCGKVCSRPSTLKTHYLIHTGDTPFKCTWHNCDKSFNVKSNMLRHLKSHERKLKRESQ